MSKNHFWKEFSFFLFSFLKFKIFSRIGFKNSIVNFSKKWIFWGLEQLVHRVFFLKQKVFWVLKTQVIFNDLGQWQGRKKLTKKRFSTMVRLSFTCTSALFSTGVVSDSIYFILFSLSPFASQRMIKNCGQLNHGKERGCFGGVIQSILPYFYPQVCFCSRFMEGFVISERYIAFRQNDKLESIFKN